MIEDLMKLKKQIDTMIETYKDLHPDEEYDEYSQTHTAYRDEEDENYLLGRGVWDSEEVQKERALKKIREGTYESTFREKQRQKTTKPSQGSPSLCVYGDS
tara:strand:- start:181 stop:483 length:303 start_codon:yes stop_codon:yes gene_type:complete